MDIKSLFGYEGKNVVITGSGSGMGYAAARLLAALGANVYATVRRKPLDFAVTKEIKVDLSNPEELDALPAQLPEKIDALFICHGISNTVGITNGLEVQLTNFYSFKQLTNLLLPRVVDNGSVSFITSEGGKGWRTRLQKCLEIIACKTWKDALDWYAANPECTNDGYVFAKECQHAFIVSKCRAPEFINRRIRINAVAPGLTATGLTHDFNASINGDAAYGQQVLEQLFLGPWNGRWASAEEMGYPLAAIGSNIFSYMTGQILYIDYGGAADWEFRELQKKV